jgi:group I intron endonuclease
MSGIIYATRCLVSGKLYVGLHTRGQKHYLGSGTVLKTAVKKYGRDKFIRKTIDSFETTEEGKAKERRWIAELNSKAPLGYNLCEGGEGTFRPCEELRIRMSAAHRGKRHTDETRAKMSKAQKGNAHFLGHRHPEETKAKMSAAMAGNLNGLGNRSRKGQPAWNKGIPWSAEVRAKISAAMTGNVNATGEL